MDFPDSEFETRLARAQRVMAKEGLEALFLMSEAEIRWFTGFRTLFWQSPTRPWFLIVPQEGKPIAIIPEIGAALMRRTWIDDIRTWAAPNIVDDGISLLADALSSYETIGLMMGHETSFRMPLADFEVLRDNLRNSRFTDATGLVQHLRMVKSEAEIAVIGHIAEIACNAFDRAGGLFQIGQPRREVFRTFRIALLEEGADDVPYLVGALGNPGYDDVISPADASPVAEGDVLMLDTGATLNGYFCDFDRNFAFGRADDRSKAAHQTLWHATEAGLDAARPGATCADLFQAMHKVIGGKSDVGRYGHGLGMQLTEQPSIIDWDNMVLEPGMVMTLEPSMPVEGGGMMVHEENIVIRDGPPQLLTRRETADLKVL